MGIQRIVFTLVGFLHNFFTVIWLGGLAFMVLTFFPAVKKRIGKSSESKELVTTITRQHRVWVYICIMGLFVTGILLGKANPNQTGFMHFDTTYAIIASVKHILTFFMILVAVFRSVFFGKEHADCNKKNNLGKLPILINFALGVIVLLLSSIMASI